MSLSRSAKITTAAILSKLTTVFADTISFTFTDPEKQTYVLTRTAKEESDPGMVNAISTYAGAIKDRGFQLLAVSYTTTPNVTDYKSIVSCGSVEKQFSFYQASNAPLNHFGTDMASFLTSVCSDVLTDEISFRLICIFVF